MIANFSIWWFILALVALCLAFGFTMERINRKRHERKKQEAMQQLRDELAGIIKRNRKALGESSVDNICSDTA